MVIIKKKLTAAAVISFTILGLCACGKETAGVSTVSVDKEGKVESVLYDAFDKDYYSLDELTNMAEDEISGYNSEYETPRITLSDAQLLEDEAVVKLTLDFESTSDYSYYNQVDLFYGTVEEARNSGYELNLNLVDDKGDKIDPWDYVIAAEYERTSYEREEGGSTLYATNGQKDEDDDVLSLSKGDFNIANTVDWNEEGVYEILYRLEDESDRTGSQRLVVVVY